MSQLDDVVVPLLSARIFSGLSAAQLKALALDAEAITFKRGDVVLRAYQEGDAAFLIASGSVIEQLEQDDSGRPQEFSTGAMLGELAMLVETLHSATIVARTPVRALKFKRETMQALMLKDPTLAEHFTDKLRQRLLETAKKLREVDQMFGGPVSGQSEIRVLS